MVRQPDPEPVPITAVGNILKDPAVCAAFPIVTEDAQDRVARHRTEGHHAARNTAAVEALCDHVALIGNDRLAPALRSGSVEQDIDAQVSHIALLVAPENALVVEVQRAPGAAALKRS